MLPKLNNSHTQISSGRYDQLKRLLNYLKDESEDCLFLNLYVPKWCKYSSTALKIQFSIWFAVFQKKRRKEKQRKNGSSVPKSIRLGIQNKFCARFLLIIEQYLHTYFYKRALSLWFLLCRIASTMHAIYIFLFFISFQLKIVVIIFRFGSWYWTEANLSSDCIYPWWIVRME